MGTDTAHPTVEQLNAFSLGQLPRPDAAAVEAHINQCKPCCETLLGISNDDTFVSLLRDADRAVDEATVAMAAPSTSGQTAEVAQVPASLAQHDRYDVLRLIGRGGMGDVYRAEHRLMKRKVALKVINRNLISKPEAVERFRREVRAAAQLSHPNIVTAFDAEQAGDVHFLAMEYVDGTPLSEIVQQRGPLPVDEAVDFVRQATAGLQHASEAGMVHRDIKPHNLMLDTARNVKILDFGLAGFVSELARDGPARDASEPTAAIAKTLEHLTHMGAMMGTPDYISPEQAEDAREADIRSDIYSLGCTLYFLLAGRAPFSDSSLLDKLTGHAQRKPQPISQIRDDLPPGLEEVLQTMMAKNPAQRYQTPAQAGEALAEVLLPSATVKPPAGPRSHFEFASRFGVGALIAICLGLMLKAGGQSDAGAGIATLAGLAIAWGATYWAMASPPAEPRRKWNWVPTALLAATVLAVTGLVLLASGLTGKRQPSVERPQRQGVTQVSSNMTAEEFRAKNRELGRSNYRPIQLSGLATDGKARFTAIWRQDQQASFDSRAYVDMSATNFQTVFDRLTQDGYRLTRISGFSSAGKSRYAGIFEQRDGPPWQARLAVPDDAFQQLFNELTGDGYRMVDVSGFVLQGKPHVASIWEQTKGPAWQAFPGVSSERFQQLFEQLTGQGYRLLRISGFTLDDQSRYASIWQQQGETLWLARIDLTPDQYALVDQQYADKGFYKTQLCELQVDGQRRLAAIWQKTADDEAAPQSDSAPASSTPLSAGNLVRNGGFENASDPRGTQAPYWMALRKTTATEPPADCQRDPTISASGDASATIVKPSVENERAEAGFMQVLSALPAGKTLRVAGQIKTKEVEGAAAIKLRLRDPGREGPDSFLGMVETPAVDGTSDWQSYETQIRIPSHANGELALVLQGSGTAWFDDMEVSEVPSQSLLINGGFDEVVNGHLASWTPVGRAAGLTLAADSQMSYTGSASATIINRGDSVEPNNWRQEVTGMPVRQTVTLTGWVKTQDAAMAAVAVQLLDQERQMVAFHTTQNDVSLQGTSDWRRFTLQFPIPPETKRLAVLAMLAGRGQVWFDDFEMKPGGSPAD